MVAQYPVTMECRVTQVADQPSSEFFFGEVVNVYADEACLVGGVHDLERIRTFTLSMPDNRYWEVGEIVGTAWGEGKRFDARGPVVQ